MRALRLAMYVVRSVLRSFRGSVGLHALAVGTVAAAFLILGGAGVLFFNLRGALLGAQGDSDVSVYFRDGAPAESVEKIRGKFCAEAFVSACTFRTKDQARAWLLSRHPDLEPAVRALEDNPFPASLEIDVSSDFRDRSELRRFADEIRAMKDVEAVDDGGEFFSRWVALVSWAEWAMLVLGSALAMAVVFVVGNTIRLVVLSRRDEVEILSLVGATDRLVRLPFVVEGGLHGALGSAFALWILKLGFVLFEHRMAADWAGIMPVALTFFQGPEQAAFVALGAVLGVVGSAIAVGRLLPS